ncbi:vitelline membrane protein Vm26Ab-like [Anoplophora glabripennis]|uniref:vitelline membrane protein Vm26Ab-like n=1 Tax=Anoplophora glabripennis TaxID=217634 RepID=UPI0008742032|nr:vitelline membrane protein Vm26Ab-like [Anoplophora glabripennis]
MNSLVFVALLAVFAAANAGVLTGAPLISAYGAAPVVSAYSAPLVGAGLVGEQTVVAGPSGTIATGRTLGAPAFAAYAAPAVAAYSSPIVSSYAAPAVVARTIW